MSLRTRTIVRVLVSGLLLALMALGIARYGPVLGRTVVVTMGLAFVAAGPAAFLLDKPVRKLALDWEKQVEPVLGYVPPMWVRASIRVALAISGAALAFWGWSAPAFAP
jgi:hypothetical protein